MNSPASFTRFIATASFGLAALASAAAHADPVADFYKGKQIEFIAAGEIATSQDLWARLLARYMPNYIPGHPGMVVKNIPGSGHIRAGNYLFNVAPRDGTTIGTFSATIITGYIMKVPGITYDVTRFNWLGSPDKSNRICVARAGASVQKAADLFERELIVGGTGATGGISGPPTLLRRLLGMRFRLVEGYPGPQSIYIAMERGELDGLCSQLSGIESTRPNWIAEGKLKLLFNMERDRLPGYDAPTAYEFTTSDEQRRILTFYGAGLDLGRPFFTPPDVPRERVAALRNAFAAALADPKFIEEARKQLFEIAPITGEQLERTVHDLAMTPADIIEKTNRLLGPSD
jgi:tripartite-type tricarboxylate transporter receptor subunit TctC